MPVQKVLLTRLRAFVKIITYRENAMIETIIAGIMSFVGTNIDDIFINTLFFAQADTKRKIQSVVIGKYLGSGSLMLLTSTCFAAKIVEKS